MIDKEGNFSRTISLADRMGPSPEPRSIFKMIFKDSNMQNHQKKWNYNAGSSRVWSFTPSKTMIEIEGKHNFPRISFQSLISSSCPRNQPFPTNIVLPASGQISLGNEFIFAKSRYKTFYRKYAYQAQDVPVIVYSFLENWRQGTNNFNSADDRPLKVYNVSSRLGELGNNSFLDVTRIIRSKISDPSSNFGFFIIQHFIDPMGGSIKMQSRGYIHTVLNYKFILELTLEPPSK